MTSQPRLKPKWPPLATPPTAYSPPTWASPGGRACSPAVRGRLSPAGRRAGGWVAVRCSRAGRGSHSRSSGGAGLAGGRGSAPAPSSTPSQPRQRSLHSPLGLRQRRPAPRECGRASGSSPVPGAGSGRGQRGADGMRGASERAGQAPTHFPVQRSQARPESHFPTPASPGLPLGSQVRVLPAQVLGGAATGTPPKKTWNNSVQPGVGLEFKDLHPRHPGFQACKLACGA